MGLALRIETERLVLRCREPADAPLLKHAVDISLVHLRAWMPWAMQEPSELHAIEERLERSRSQFLSGADYSFGIFDKGETEYIGGAGLHPGIGPRALELGYWIRVDRTRQGFATEAAGALTAAGLALPDIDRLEIHCDPANTASAAIPRRLGYRFLKTVMGNKLTPLGEPRDTLVFEMTVEDHRLLRSAGSRDDAEQVR